ncbi:PorT family protein [Pedobacter frigiditerrae]|uniref:PorT family protein n=1 Tax=Pedobacter frigiditerrae TaxID=2530452 RepID=A0A4R0MLB1_9SPHI|nr:outer membrane beta-barrel protein [Pedobacter frigiditerrae]TCC86962.1 PorT family protein [Pedobacter frigiditerrae]
MRKKLTLLLIITLFSFSIAKSQNWGGGIDGERFNWGFSFQYISSELKITKNSNWRQPYYDQDLGAYVTDTLSSISSPTSVGFGIGFVVNSSIHKNVDVRFTPTLVFNDRLVNYTYVVPGTFNASNPVVQKKIQATMVDFPVGLKLKSDRLMNVRAYMLGGLKYSIDLASSKKTNDVNAAPIDKLLKNKKSFLSYEAGLGFDIYFEWFKMSPEVKVSYSFKDILKHEPQPYANPIDKAKLRHFTFSLFFE